MANFTIANLLLLVIFVILVGGLFSLMFPNIQVKKDESLIGLSTMSETQSCCSSNCQRIP